MKRLKHILALLLIAVSVVIPAVTALMPQPVSASSWDGSNTSMSRVQAYLYGNAMAYCLTKYGGPFTVSESDMLASSYFGNTKTQLGVSVDVGHMLEHQDGKVNCKDGAGDWVNKALELWGLSPSEQFTSMCTLGWTRKNNPSPISIDACAQGGGDFTAPSSSTFFKNLNSQLYQIGSSVSLPLTDADRYTLWSNSFVVGCGGIDQGPYSDAKNEVKSQANSTDSGSNYFKMKVPDGSGGAPVHIFKASQDRNNNIDTRVSNYNNKLANEAPECQSMVTQANNFAAAYANYLANSKDASGVPGDPSNSTSTAAGNGNEGIGTDCGGFTNIVTDTLNWLMCPIIKGAKDAAGQLDNGIMSMLCIDETQVFGASASTCSSSSSDKSASNGYKAAWNAFRIIALGLLVIAGLVMVLSQTIGLEIVDAYTIRKTLPRLLVAAIGISLSWQLLQFFVTLSNVLGIGIRGLIYAPFVHAGLNNTVLQGGAGAVGVILGLSSLALLGAIGVLSFVATGLLAVVIAFFLLILRNILVIILLITAPVAIVAYILPNTQGIWKTWWSWFSKALMVFPIITAFIAAGHVFAAIASSQGGTAQENGTTSTISSMIAVIAYFAPYFLIPLAFRFAGGALGTLGGFVNDRSRGGFDRLKKFRGNQSAHNMAKIREGERFTGSRFIPGSERAAHMASMALQAPTLGARGHFGVGARGMQRRGQLAQTNYDNYLKERPDFQRTLIAEDDTAAAIALSGGTDSGLSRSGRRLQQHWMDNEGMSEAAASERAERAVTSARSLGVNATAAGAALNLMAQNKSRAIGAGDYEIVQQGIHELSHGNTQLEQDLAYNFQYNSRQAGRADLGGNWTGGSVAQASGAAAKRRALFMDGVARTEVRNLVGGHTAGVEQARRVITDDFKGNDAASMLQSAALLNELQGNLTGATASNRDAIIKTLDDLNIDYKSEGPGAVSIQQQLINEVNRRSGANVTVTQLQNISRTWGSSTPTAARNPGEPPEQPTPSGGAP